MQRTPQLRLVPCWASLARGWIVQLRSVAQSKQIPSTMSRKFERLDDLSPFILKGRIDRIKNKIAKLERQRAAAREADQQWQVKRESERAEARKRLGDIQAKLAKVRQEMESIKNDPSSFQPRPRFWGLVAGRPSELELSIEAKRRLSDLEAQEADLLDEEYCFEVEAGLEMHPEVIRMLAVQKMPPGYLNGVLRDPKKNVAPLKLSEKYILYRWRHGYRALKRLPDHLRTAWFLASTRSNVKWQPDGPYHPSCSEAYLDKQIEPLMRELSRLEEALGPQEQKLAELESWRARGMNETRELARRVRMSFSPTDVCPYCGKAMGSEARLDHIYPVSKGGLSVRSNLVFVCLECNQKKSDMTLAAFVKACNLDREAIEARLNQLGKEF
jgi:hypothetical protein